MILQELRQSIEAEGTVSRKELAQRYALTEDGVDAMLEIWLRKGVISRLVDTRSGKVSRVRYRINAKDGLSLHVVM